MKDLIRLWHELGKWLHTPRLKPSCPEYGELDRAARQQLIRFQLAVHRKKAEFHQATEQLAAIAEQNGLDSTPYWDLFGNIEAASLELWGRCWTLTERLETRFATTALRTEGDPREQFIAKRNKWLYEQRMAGHTWREVRDLFAKKCKEQQKEGELAWPFIRALSSLQCAAKKHIKDTGALLLPQGKAGRPRT